LPPHVSQLALIYLADLETRQGNYREAEGYYSKVSAYSGPVATVFDRIVDRARYGEGEGFAGRCRFLDLAVSRTAGIWRVCCWKKVDRRMSRKRWR